MARQWPGTYAAWFDNCQPVFALTRNACDLLNGIVFACAWGKRIEHENNDAGRGLAMPHRKLAKAPVVGDQDAPSRCGQSERPVVAIALANFLRVHDIEAARAQPLDNESGHAFVSEKNWHDRLLGGKNAFFGKIIRCIGLRGPDILGGQMWIIAQNVLDAVARGDAT